MSNLLGGALSNSEEGSGDEPSPERPESLPPRSKRRRFAPLKVANQIPKRRRIEIEKALEGSTGTPISLERGFFEVLLGVSISIYYRLKLESLGLFL